MADCTSRIQPSLSGWLCLHTVDYRLLCPLPLLPNYTVTYTLYTQQEKFTVMVARDGNMCAVVWRIRSDTLQAESIDWVIEDQAFSPIWLLPRPPPFSRHQVLSLFSCVFPRRSPMETGFLHYRSCVVKTSFCHVPTIEQSKRDVFRKVNLNIFTIYYGPSDNWLCAASIVHLC